MLPAVAVALVALQVPAASLDAVLQRLADYAVAFQRQLSNIVAEERYVQDVRYPNLVPGRGAANAHRELRSDVLLVQPTGSDAYVEFRDVFEVDGRPVRDRQERLTRLFLTSGATADAQFRQIARESARYNIGNVERTINTPTLALQFLLPAYQARFRFTPRGGTPMAIEFEEVQRPTLIRTNHDLDLPVHGRVWMDTASGRVVTTELISEDSALRATITVTYRWDDRLRLMVPAEMRERYDVRRDGAVVTGRATYDNLRQFQVTSDERLGPPPSEPTHEEPKLARPDLLPAMPVVADAQTPTVQPTFRSDTELVLVDFVVVDKSGRPVDGLSAKDFVVKEDGKEQRIVSLQAFGRTGTAPHAAANETSTRAPGLATTTSTSAPNGSTIVLVDDLHLTPDQAARLRPALKGLLTTVGTRSGGLMLVSPASQISALADLPLGAAELAPLVDTIAGHRIEEHTTFPIADAEALAIARRDLPTIARVTTRFVTLNPELTRDDAETFAIERGIEIAHEARARRDRFYDVALSCLDWLTSRPGRHSLVVVSGGFAADPDDAKYFDVVTRSLRANAPIDFLDARGLSGFNRYHDVEFGPLLSRAADEGPYGRFEAAEGTTGLAVDTGGLTVVNTNDMGKGLDQLLDSMTAYYVAAYRPPPHEKRGFRKIKVEVRGKGLHVRARTGYFSEPAAPR